MAGFKLWEGESLLTGEPIVVIATMNGNNPKTDNVSLWCRLGFYAEITE